MTTQFLQSIGLVIIGLVLIVAGGWAAFGFFAAESMLSKMKEHTASVGTAVLGVISLAAIAAGIYLVRFG